MAKNLVAYFSVSGVTKNIAEEIAQAADAVCFAIEPEQPYTRDDINWRNKSSRSSLEENNPDARPAIKSKVDEMDSYENIFIGFPIWWHTCPKIITTFVESYNLNGKTIIPFATSGGSGIEKAAKYLKSILPDSKVLDGRVFNNRPGLKVIEDWVNSLGL